MPIDLPTVILTNEAEVRPAAVSTLGAALGALRSWEVEDGVRAVMLVDAPAPRTLPVDEQRAARLARIETGLKDARATLDFADVSYVDALRASLAIVYGEARAHPDDPEAGALVAESLRTLARVEALAGDAEGAAALRLRANALDGGRKLGLSEGPDLGVAAVPPVTFTLVLEGAPAGARLRLDGARLAAADGGESIALSVVPGEHHLRVVLPGPEPLDGPAVHASFFVVSDAAAQVLRLRVGEPAAACTTTDLAPALRATASDPRASFEVACARWARVVRVSDEAIDVRLCGKTACGGKISWKAPPKSTNGTGKTPGNEGSSAWSSPWTYVAIGAAAVVTGGVVAWRLGAFERGDAPPPTWRWEGVGGR